MIFKVIVTNIYFLLGGESCGHTFNTQRVKFYRRGPGSVPVVCSIGPTTRCTGHRSQERPHALVSEHE